MEEKTKVCCLYKKTSETENTDCFGSQASGTSERRLLTDTLEIVDVLAV